MKNSYRKSVNYHAAFANGLGWFNDPQLQRITRYTTGSHPEKFQTDLLSRCATITTNSFGEPTNLNWRYTEVL
jgi:hypothetical protein